MSDSVRHKSVAAKGMPAPIGPYSPAVVYEKLIFASGQLPVDPSTGKVPGGDIEAQTAQALKNLAAVLEAAGSDLSKVLRCGVFLTNLADFPGMNKVYAEHFGENRPARTTVQAAALPGTGVKIEIDAVAYV